MSLNIKSVRISGMEVLPIIEGGKGIGCTNGTSAGAFARASAVGTFSGVNATSYDNSGKPMAPIYHGKTRNERHEELVQMGISGAVAQAKIAHDLAGGKGPIHMNILWEMGGAERILRGTLDKTKGLINGITCGAGMPYRLAEIAVEYNVYYYPIISSMRAFRALWKRSYAKLPHELLGGVVYEDPWKAGGHNGLTTNEDPLIHEDPYPRIVELRHFMNEVGLSHVPIIMAGGVWELTSWKDWLDNKEIGLIAFQFGTRPLLTQESPIPMNWKKKLLTLKEGDVFLNRFSPTGFYSSAVYNDFMKELEARSIRQIYFQQEKTDDFITEFRFGPRKRVVYIKNSDLINANEYINNGFNEILRTPDNSLIFVTPEKAGQIHEDQVNCMGCLSSCKFSNWADHGDYMNGQKPDPRSFCIQKTLQDIVLNGDVENNLMFSGHNAFKFGQDEFYSNGFIPTIQELVNRIMIGK